MQHALTALPTSSSAFRAIYNEHYVLARAAPFGTHDFVEGQLHSPRIDVREEAPLGSAIAGVDESVDLAPLIAVRADRPWALAPARPHAPNDGLEPSPGLLVRPHFHPGPGMRGAHGGYRAPELFLNACCCAGVAARA